MTQYSTAFFDALHAQVQASAAAIVPHVVDLLRPARVADVGCGTGTWLAAFRAHGVADIRGFDGQYVDRSKLEIPSDRFMPVNLEEAPRLDGHYDLAVCLEVAEHLPASRAGWIVESLTGLAPVVLFSAAIPQQGGVHHVNEQWPEYWTAEFARHGYEVIDCLRRRFWNDERVAWFYAQNMLLFADRATIERTPALLREQEASRDLPLSIVHPNCFSMRVSNEHYLVEHALREVVAALPRLSKRALARRLKWHRAAAS
jgi:SAM-dependent methyltransferase